MTSRGYQALAALLLAAAIPARAADIRLADVNGDMCNPLEKKVCFTLLVEGTIQKGDNATLIALVNKLTTKTTRVGKVHFDSPGGDVFEAMELGRTIRRGLMMTQVTSDSRCYSACVVAFVGGVIRAPIGEIGVHSFYSKEFTGLAAFAEASTRHNEVAARTEAYLREMRIPTALLDEMQRTPSYILKDIKAEEREKPGLLGVDPVYTQLYDTQLKKNK